MPSLKTLKLSNPRNLKRASDSHLWAKSTEKGRALGIFAPVGEVLLGRGAPGEGRRGGKDDRRRRNTRPGGGGAVALA
eukprot:6365600-Pyramimonas_sp.AAC.2